ncbi:MAG TPA: hypothetical protein VGF94_07975 [Kofleriaceae bacterium]|jgi:hypothetical protein
MRAVVIAVAVVLCLGGAVFGIAMALRASTSHVTGTITGTGGDLGTWTMQVDRCQSGQRNEFRGVQLYGGDSDAHGTAFVDPIGSEPIITIAREHGGDARQFTKAECRVLEGKIENQKSTINRITNIKGYVRFDCTWQAEHATGDVTFDNCH